MDCIYVGKMIKEGRKRENLTQKERSIPMNEILTNEDKQNIKRRNCFTRIVIVCLVFLVVGIGSSFLYLVTMPYIKRIYLLIIVSSFLIMFVSAVLIILWREMRK